MRNNSQSTNDWPTFSYDLANTGYNPHTTGPKANVGIRWTATIDGAAGSSTPVVANERVFVGGTGTGGDLLAIDSNSGTRSWEYDTVGHLSSAPTVVGDVVYTLDSTGRVDAITTSGDRLWRRSLDGRALGCSPVVADETIYVGLADGTSEDDTAAERIFALDATNGEVRWTVPTTDWITTSPAVSGDTVFFGDDGGVLHALDTSSGDERWRFEAGYAIDSAPAVADGRVYFGTFHPTGTTSSRVYALDASSGAVDWTFDAVPPRIATSPAVTVETVFVGCYGPPPGPTDCNRYECDNGSFGLLYALDHTDGSIRWKRKTVPDLRSSPAVASDTVFFGRGTGVEALDAETGRTRSAIDLGQPVPSSPAVSDGQLFVGCADGTVYAISESGDQ